MATLKEVQSKIVSVKKTKQITSAMKMVATSRLRGAQSSMEAFKPYAGKFAEVLGSIAGKAGDSVSPLLVPRDEVKKVALILCTSDRGLCGGFNVHLISKAEKFIQSELAGKEVSFICFGKKGRDWAKKQPQPIEDEFIGVVGGKVEFSIASSSGQKLIDSFLEGAVDEVYLIYSEFVSMSKQQATIRQILPIPPLEAGDGEEQKGSDGHIWIMIHSGSRNLGKQVADHYNKIAVEFNLAIYQYIKPKQERKIDESCMSSLSCGQ